MAAVIAQEDAEEAQAQSAARERHRLAEAARNAAQQKQVEEAALIAAQIKAAEESERKAEETALARAKSRPADPFCVFSCDPSEENGRQALRNQLRGMFETKVVPTNFRKTNGARARLSGFDVYEMHFETEDRRSSR